MKRARLRPNRTRLARAAWNRGYTEHVAREQRADKALWLLWVSNISYFKSLTVRDRYRMAYEYFIRTGKLPT